MMVTLRRLFGSNVEPITHETVVPAPRDEERELEIRAANGHLVGEVMNLERRSWEIRRELAGNALRIVAGDTP